MSCVWLPRKGLERSGKSVHVVVFWKWKVENLRLRTLPFIKNSGQSEFFIGTKHKRPLVLVYTLIYFGYLLLFILENNIPCVWLLRKIKNKMENQLIVMLPIVNIETSGLMTLPFIQFPVFLTFSGLHCVWLLSKIGEIGWWNIMLVFWD